MACACSSGRTYTLQLIERHQHTRDTFSFDFAALEPLQWKEGDSSKLYVPISGEMVGKKFSYATLPEEHRIRFTTRIRNLRSRYKDTMDRLKVGDFVEVSGPGGHFCLERDGRPALLLSNGVGIATMRPLVLAYDNDGAEVPRMIQINVDSTGSIYEDEFAGIAMKNDRFKSIYADHRQDFYSQVDFASQEIMFTTGLVPHFYVVGSDDFIQNVSGYLMSVGFDLADIITDGQSVGGGCGCSSEESAGCGCGSSGGCGCEGDIAKCDCGKY